MPWGACRKRSGIIRFRMRFHVPLEVDVEDSIDDRPVVNRVSRRPRDARRSPLEGRRPVAGDSRLCAEMTWSRGAHVGNLLPSFMYVVRLARRRSAISERAVTFRSVDLMCTGRLASARGLVGCCGHQVVRTMQWLRRRKARIRPRVRVSQNLVQFVLKTNCICAEFRVSGAIRRRRWPTAFGR